MLPCTSGFAFMFLCVQRTLKEDGNFMSGVSWDKWTVRGACVDEFDNIYATCLDCTLILDQMVTLYREHR